MSTVFNEDFREFIQSLNDNAFSRAMQFDENGLMVRFIHLNNLIEAKKASGRYKDLDDIEKLSPGTDFMIRREIPKTDIASVAC